MFLGAILKVNDGELHNLGIWKCGVKGLFEQAKIAQVDWGIMNSNFEQFYCAFIPLWYHQAYVVKRKRRRNMNLRTLFQFSVKEVFAKLFFFLRFLIYSVLFSNSLQFLPLSTDIQHIFYSCSNRSKKTHPTLQMKPHRKWPNPARGWNRPAGFVIHFSRMKNKKKHARSRSCVRCQRLSCMSRPGGKRSCMPPEG